MTGPAIATLEDLAIRLVVAVALALAAWLLVQARAYLAAHTSRTERHNLADQALQICGAAEQEFRGLPDSGPNKFSWADGKLHNALPKLTEAQRKTLIEDAVRAINAGVVTLAPYLASGAGAAGLAPLASFATPLASFATPLASFATPLASVVAHGVADAGGVGGVGGLDIDALKADLLAAVRPLAREAAAQAAPGALADAFTRLTTAAAPPDPAPAPPLPSASAKTLHIVESTNHDDVIGVMIQPSSADTTATAGTAGLVTTSGEPERPATVLPLTPSTSPTATP